MPNHEQNGAPCRAEPTLTLDPHSPFKHTMNRRQALCNWHKNGSICCCFETCSSYSSETTEHYSVFGNATRNISSYYTRATRRSSSDNILEDGTICYILKKEKMNRINCMMLQCIAMSRCCSGNTAIRV